MRFLPRSMNVSDEMTNLALEIIDIWRIRG